MQLFLKRVLLFSVLLLSYFGINYIINNQILKSTLPKVNSRTLIVGASDVQNAIDPALFASAENIAQLGEPYFITHWKLKHLLSYNKIDTVLLGISPFNFSSIYENNLSKKMPFWSTALFRRIYAIADFESVPEMDIDFRKFYTMKFKAMCLHPKKGHHHYIGSHKKHSTNVGNPSNYEYNINLHYSFEGQPASISELALNSLDGIVELCKEKGVALVLVAMPMHEKYSKRVPKNFVENYKEVKAKLARSSIKVLDFRHAAYTDDEFFDSCHLNGKGAKKFTENLTKALANR